MAYLGGGSGASASRFGIAGRSANGSIGMSTTRSTAAPHRANPPAAGNAEGREFAFCFVIERE